MKLEAVLAFDIFPASDAEWQIVEMIDSGRVKMVDLVGIGLT